MIVCSLYGARKTEIVCAFGVVFLLFYARCCVFCCFLWFCLFVEIFLVLMFDFKQISPLSVCVCVCACALARVCVCMFVY